MTISSMLFELLKFFDKFGIIFLAIILISYIIISISLYHIYRKMRIDEKKALIPIYNIIILLDIVSLPKYLWILIFVPYINILGLFIMFLIIGWRLGRVFNCSFMTRLGLMLFPVITYPALSKKNLNYRRLEPSPRLIKEKVKVEKKEFVLEVPKYDVDVNSIDNISAIDINEFVNNKDIKSDKSSTTINEDNEVADLTFDYEQLYDIKKDNVEDDLNMNQDGQYSETMSMESISPTIPIADIPTVASSPVMPTMEIESIPEVSVVSEPITTTNVSENSEIVPMVDMNVPEIPEAPMMPTMEEPFVPVAPVMADDPNLGNEIISPIPEIVDTEKIVGKIPEPEAPKEKPASKDGITFDYDSLYNVNSPEFSNQPNKENKQKNSDVNIDSFQMAAPPSFELPVVPEIDEEEQVTPAVPEIKKEDLVSVKIDEPDALPVFNVGDKKKSNNVNNQVGPNNEMMNQRPNMMPNNGMMNQGPNMMPNNGMMNQGQNMRPNNGMMNQGPNMMSNNGIMNQGPNMMPNNGMMNQGPNMMPNNGMMNQGYNNTPNPYNNQTSNSLLRSNEDSRAQENVQRGPIGAKFISNDDTKYTLPKEETVPVQMPTDPELIANPMAIFGVSSGTIRPTSGEAMRQDGGNQQPQQPSVSKCPNCGFMIKPGQPTCVVCGCRLQ